MIFKKINDKFYNLFNLRLVATTKSFFWLLHLNQNKLLQVLFIQFFVLKFDVLFQCIILT